MIAFLTRGFVYVALVSVLSGFTTAPLQEIQLSTGMLIHPYSNREMTHMTLQLHDGTNHLYWATNQRLDAVHPWAGKIWRGFLTGIVANRYHIGELYTLAHHELGHATRGRAYGYKQIVYKVHFGDDQRSSELSHYYALILELLKQNASITKATTTLSDGPNVADSVSTDETIVIVSAGGVNNEIQLAQAIENRFYTRQDSSVYDIIPYLTAKQAIGDYAESEKRDPGGDLSNINLAYSNKGISLSWDEYKRYNGYAVLASGTFWRFLDGWSRYIATGIDSVSNREFYRFRQPDVNMYLLSHGPSYHVQSGYRFSEKTHIPVALERVFLGEIQNEWTLGLHHHWTPGIVTESEIRVGANIGGRQAVRMAIKQRWTIAATIDSMDARNLYGERNSVSLKKGNRNTDLSVSMRYQL